MRPTAGPVLASAFSRALRHAIRHLLIFVRTSPAIIALIWAANGHAGAFIVNPVRIELSTTSPTAVLQVDNTQGSPVTIQLSTMAWSQPAGKDELKPTREILATPQIFTLQPGATQLLRIGALRKPDAEQELGYRLLLEEIPPPPAPDFKGLQVALRISLPIFIKPAAAAHPQLSAVFRRDAPQALRVQLTNAGKAAAHLQNLSIHPDRNPDRTLAAHPSAVYVLPGQTRELSLRLAETASDDLILIRAVMHGKPLELHASSPAD